MRSRAWGLAGGCALALPVVVALVVWRAPAASPGWRTALAVVAVLAVVALLSAAGTAGVQALRADGTQEVSVSVPRGGGAPVAAVADPDGPRRWTVLALLIALAGTAPVLVVLVLASSVGDARAATPVAPPPASSPSPSSPTTPTPTTTSPTTPTPTTPAPAPDQPAPSPSSPTEPPPSSPETSPPAEPGEVPSADAPPDQGCTAVVSRGDTLWGLALSRLTGTGAEPDDDALTAETARLYAANTGVVGPDPDLLRPGQRLDVCP